MQFHLCGVWIKKLEIFYSIEKIRIRKQGNHVRDPQKANYLHYIAISVQLQILFSIFVPISLLVSKDIRKALQT